MRSALGSPGGLYSAEYAAPSGALAGQGEYLQTAAPGLLLLRQQRGMLEDAPAAQGPLCRQ